MDCPRGFLSGFFLVEFLAICPIFGEFYGIRPNIVDHFYVSLLTFFSAWLFCCFISAWPFALESKVYGTTIKGSII